MAGSSAELDLYVVECNAEVLKDSLQVSEPVDRSVHLGKNVQQMFTTTGYSWRAFVKFYAQLVLDK